MGTFLAQVEVVAGESRAIGPLSLAPGGIQDFADPVAWRSDQGWSVRRGGGFVLNDSSSTAGTFIFSAIFDKGKLLQWVFNYIDDHNYELFQMDDNFFYRSQMRDGKKTDEVKIAFKSDKKRARTFQIVGFTEPDCAPDPARQWLGVRRLLESSDRQPHGW